MDFTPEGRPNWNEQLHMARRAVRQGRRTALRQMIADE
ncbi:hypothetical protein X727_12825 [Mesorhizobium sp. L103C119B0]|nr:hypothetical protein X727_12825 [Mesorhizobium sp. L103C119B0]